MTLLCVYLAAAGAILGRRILLALLGLAATPLPCWRISTGTLVPV